MTPFFIIAGAVVTIIGIAAIVAVSAAIFYVRVLGFPLTLKYERTPKNVAHLLTPDLLANSGWKKVGDVWVLKSTPRLGWNEKTHKFYLGYGELPQPVDYVCQLQRIYEVCSIEEEIEL